MKKLLLPATILAAITLSLTSQAQQLDLTLAKDQAVLNDPWLSSSKHQQAAVNAESIAAATLPDPVISLSVDNLATDTFHFDQENMTQLKVGVNQRIPRGDTLSLKQQQLKVSSQQYPLMRENRKEKVRVMVSELWLNAYRAEQTITLIEQDKTLFSQLVQLIESRYANVLGSVRQQDIVRAQLELTRLQDRLQVLRQQASGQKAALGQWLGADHLALPLPQTPATTYFSEPVPELIEDFNQQIELLLGHPGVQVFDKKIAASGKGVELAHQGYKPEFNVRASYGYRDNMETGQSRADFFSLGVSFDVPLFTENKQDKLLDAALARKEAIKTDKQVLIRQFQGDWLKTQQQLKQLLQRERLFNEQLLPQISEQTEAAINAYTHDTGEFSEVMRARIAQLNAKIDALNIHIDKQILLTRLNYYRLGESTATDFSE